jgi:lipopolysaccharide heptosyltransferase II
LLVRVDLLGDTVLLTAAVRTLRRGYPHARIDVLVLPSTAGVLAGDPDIDAILTWDPLTLVDPAKARQLATWRDAWRCLRRLRSARYDLAVSLCGDAASILARVSGAPRRVGYEMEAYPHFLTDPVPGGRYREPKHEVQYVLELAVAAGGHVLPEDAQPWLRVPPEARERMVELLALARACTGSTGPIVAIHPGARNGSAKRWPLRSYAVLADRLVSDLNALVVLTGSPNEVPLADEICRRAHVHITDLTGQTSLPELVGLLAQSDVVVTGDSGPMHIACAVRTPVVALHGPTDPGQSGPTAPDALVLRHDLACSPCYDSSATAECRFGNPVCMKQITPGMVFAAVHRQLVRHGWRASAPASARGNPAAITLP